MVGTGPVTDRLLMPPALSSVAIEGATMELGFIVFGVLIVVAAICSLLWRGSPGVRMYTWFGSSGGYGDNDWGCGGGDGD